MQADPQPSGKDPESPPLIGRETGVTHLGAPVPPSGGLPLPHGLKRWQIVTAFGIAGVSDGISAFAAFAPPLEWAVDLITAGALFAVLGWRWLLLPGLVMEAIPGLGVVPFWVLVVSAIVVWGTVRPKIN